MKSFVAQWDGRCGFCDGQILGGCEEIVMIDDEPCHVDCAEDEGYEIDSDD